MEEANMGAAPRKEGRDSRCSPYYRIAAAGSSSGLLCRNSASVNVHGTGRAHCDCLKALNSRARMRQRCKGCLNSKPFTVEKGFPLTLWSATAAVPDLVDGVVKGIPVPGRFGAMYLPEGV